MYEYGFYTKWWSWLINGLVQDCSSSSANALELLQSCTKPLICFLSLAEIFIGWNLIQP